MRLHVHEWGSGPRVVLVHGVLLGGREAWRAQRPLTERWTLLAPDRLGHGKSPDGVQDFEVDAGLIVEQVLDEPAHLVGLSYGAIVAMLAAARRPEMVRTLTVVEPPATGIVRGDEVVDRWDAELRQLLASPLDDPREVFEAFFPLAGVPLPIPDPVPETLRRGARALIGMRPPGDAELPLDVLSSADFPMLVLTGGHRPEYEIIADAIVAGTGADRDVVAGMAHLVPDTGAPFNTRLESFLNHGE
ncbi:alpha/beta fold hydrolase [Amycolatopsis umgeniensis]|uniref:Pimeloyl-ACP methyl ester carboxylesterase n=1 Tax=Amycolatopsis umgeniensis TaxID=336628 RepID=A0A841B2U0_9PSEU|nr:alpha/beta hydrolase [Amycolatopsis umgeniensis]MBB5855379.1 pimeloyl-ACP methyl ester carboxylesterase [Amycolatopsis umgeniensis]